MTGKGYSRRDFIKRNSLLGMGMAFGGMSPLLAGGITGRNTWEEDNSTLFFDGFTRVGLQRSDHPAGQWRLSQLLEEMDHCSVSGALVASALSVNYDLMHANLKLSAELKPYPHLFAIWNVMPHHTEEFPPPGELERLMKEHHVRALSIHPKGNAWDWKAGHCADLFEYLGKNKVLTIVTSAELGGWPDVNRFLEKYPEIPVLLIDVVWSEQRYLLPLVMKYRNLHISFNNFQINEGIEFLHEKGCTDQLIFASKAPVMSAGAHRCYIDYADIPRAARAKVSGGNLIRLLGIQAPPARSNAQEDTLMAAVRQGRPLPVPVIDMHMHMLDEGLNGAGKHYRMENGGPGGVFPMVKRLGYQGGGVMSWNGVVSYDAAAGNITTRNALDAAPKGYWGLATFDPTHYSQAELKKMIPEVYADKRFIGMKPYHLYGVEYHHRPYDSWWEYGNRHKFYALIHSSRPDLLEVETLAKKYPDVRWVIAHAGGSFRMADMAIAAVKKYPNIFAEITLTPVPLGIIEYLAEGAGEDRILYGSDLPMRDPRQQLGWVVFSRVPVAVKKKILAQNALQVIGPCMDRLPAHSRPLGHHPLQKEKK